LTTRLNNSMAICYIDKTKHKIELAETPMVENWLKVYSGKSFKINKEFDFTTCRKIEEILKTNHNLFKKFKLDFNYLSLHDLCRIETLSRIHVQIVELQKTHKKGTDLLNKNTDGLWDLLHDLLHAQESRIRNGNIEFNQTKNDVTHDSKALTENWSWESKLSGQQYHTSASFDRWHINIPTAELGRHPYECFLYSPDTWQREGSILGQIAVRIQVQLTRTHGQPERGYHEWCSQQNIPVIGNNFPLANFLDDFTSDILGASEITIEA